MVFIKAAQEVLKILAKGFRYQEKLIDTAYSRPFLPRNFNRHALKGIKHGLGAGSAFEIFNNQDLITETEDATSLLPKTTPSYNRFSKARSGRIRRSRSRECFRYRNRRYSR